MNTLILEEKTKVIAALVEVNSIRATCRMTGIAKGTVTRLLEKVVKNPKHAKYEGIFKVALISLIVLVAIIVLWLTGVLGKSSFIGICFKQSC